MLHLLFFKSYGPRNDSLPARSEMVEGSQFGGFCKFDSFQPYLSPTDN